MPCALRLSADSGQGGEEARRPRREGDQEGRGELPRQAGPRPTKGRHQEGQEEVPRQGQGSDRPRPWQAPTRREEGRVLGSRGGRGRRGGLNAVAKTTPCVQNNDRKLSYRVTIASNEKRSCRFTTVGGLEQRVHHIDLRGGSSASFQCRHIFQQRQMQLLACG